MSDFTNPTTLIMAMNNRIMKVEQDQQQSSGTARAFVITNLDGITKTYTWPVVAPSTAAEIDQLFHDLRATQSPYSDLRADTEVAARVLAACQGVVGLKHRERHALDQIRDIYDLVQDKISRAAQTHPLTTNEVEKLLRRRNIDEAKTLYLQAADLLNDFMGRRRLVMNNIIPLEARTAHADNLARGGHRFGLRALMFKEGLFV